jgi:hypothetical protein
MALAGVVLDDFSTSNSIVDTGSQTATFKRFERSATVNGQDLDLKVQIEYPDKDQFGNPNSRTARGRNTNVGFAGAGLFHSNLKRLSGDTQITNFSGGLRDTNREDFVLNFEFVKTGTNTVFHIDRLRLGIKDLDVVRDGCWTPRNGRQAATGMSLSAMASSC